MLSSALAFFYNETPTTEIYTLSLHDALPILALVGASGPGKTTLAKLIAGIHRPDTGSDRKSTRLNSSHQIISYAVFCLKKKMKTLSTNPARRSRANTSPSPLYMMQCPIHGPN